MSQQPQSQKNGRGKKFPATMAERRSEIGSSPAAPIAPPVKKEMTLDVLSSIMDASFPVEMQPSSFTSSFIVEPLGYRELSQVLYRSLIGRDEKLAHIIPEAEFIQSCGWILVHRCLDVRSKLIPTTVRDFPLYNDLMKVISELPEPLVHYLDGLGLYRDALGQTLVPELVLPHLNNVGGNTGMVPTTYANAYIGPPMLNYYGAMFPFGVYERRIIDLHTAGAHANAAAFFTQVNIAAPNVAADADLLYNPYYTVPVPIPPHPRFTLDPGMDFAAHPVGLLNSIRWNESVFQRFLYFCKRCSTIVPMLKYNRSSAGSQAQTVAAIPMGAVLNAPPSVYEYHAYGQLTTSEMHAARLFRYRIRRHVAALSCLTNNADIDASYLRAPESLALVNPPLLLTGIRGHLLFLAHFINHFIKN